jgi:hypothetical protein
MRLYNKKLNELVNMLGDRATTNIELDRVGKQMFGNKYHGTYSSDQLPSLSSRQPYCIINVDPISKGGSHWVGCCYDPKRDDLLIYDSFGRSTSKLIPSIVKKYGQGRVVDTDQDVEQSSKESSCGHRSLSFLYAFDKLGWAYAKLI